MTPDRYAMVEGGQLRPWESGEVSEKALEKRNPRVVNINGRAVHALYFGDRRWDCINGWNAEFPAAVPFIAVKKILDLPQGGSGC